MSRSVDHIVATHRLAQQRRAAGVPIWASELNVADVFHNDDLTFEEIRDAIVQRIKESPWYRGRDITGFDEFGEAVEGLAGAEDAEEFDGWWEEIYDRADTDRVWIRT